MMRTPLIIFFIFLIVSGSLMAQPEEPYRLLHGGSWSAKKIADSPDPLISYRWNNPKAADSLQIYFLRPKKTSGAPASSFKTEESRITVSGKGDLLFDFGVENAAWFEFESDDLQDTVEMSISEYNEPAIVNSGAQHAVKTLKPVKYGNIYRLQLNDELYEGVRFAWIHVSDFTRTWHISNVRLVCQVKPVNYQGSFHCNDTALNRIWYTGAYVVKLNALQDFFGAILMERSDRHSWTGDAYPAQAAALAAFGNYDAVKKNIAFTSSQDNGIAAYSMYWVLSLVEYFNYSGDSAFLKEYSGNADKRLEKAYAEYDRLPQLNFMGWDERLGAGFENPQNQESQNAYKMLCINAWKQFSRAMTSIRQNSLAAKYRQMAESKTQVFAADKEGIGRYGIHAVSEAVNAGLFTDQRVGKLSRSLFSDRLNRLSYSPFNQYFIIEAMALAGQYDLALTTVKDCWGGQLSYGGTSFFEVYRPSWNAVLNKNDAPINNQCGYTSLAHPWGAGVTKWLSENILGIRPLEPGFKTFSIIPFLSDTLSSVKGEMPTPFGPVSAAFNNKSGACEINIPKGTLAERIGFPKSGKQISRIIINKKTYWDGVASRKDVTADSNYIYVSKVKPGKYVIKITYSDSSHQAGIPAEQFNYTITSFSTDSATSGSWKNKYGSEGYLLFGGSGPNGSGKLPGYIDSVQVKKAGKVIWDSVSADTRVAEAVAGNKRLAAAIITRDPDPTFQTMTIDIANKVSHQYRLAVYFLDYDNKDRRSAVEIFDLETLNIIAPVQLIRDYRRGKYLSFMVDRPIRVRINHVRGMNAAVSAIFFDKP